MKKKLHKPSEKDAASLVTLIIRIALLILGIYLINIYIGPFTAYRIINAGNFFGLALAFVLILVSVFWSPLAKFLSKSWRSPAGKAIISVVCVLAILFCAAFCVTLSKVIGASGYTADNQSVVLVLGCQIRGSKPSGTLKARCKAASDYMKKHPGAVAIATGGQGHDEDLSEGQCIYNLMTAQGIDGKRIYIENRSTNTDANVKNAREIIDENHLSTDVAVATSEYHQYRASLICKKNGLTASSIPSRSSKKAKATFFTREVFAVWAQYLMKK